MKQEKSLSCTNDNVLKHLKPGTMKQPGFIINVTIDSLMSIKDKHSKTRGRE